MEREMYLVFKDLFVLEEEVRGKMFVFKSLFNERNSEYSGYKSYFPIKEGGKENTLFWEFGKKIIKILDMDLLPDSGQEVNYRISEMITADLKELELVKFSKVGNQNIHMTEVEELTIAATVVSMICNVGSELSKFLYEKHPDLSKKDQITIGSYFLGFSYHTVFTLLSNEIDSLFQMKEMKTHLMLSILSHLFKNLTQSFKECPYEDLTDFIKIKDDLLKHWSVGIIKGSAQALKYRLTSNTIEVVDLENIFEALGIAIKQNLGKAIRQNLPFGYKYKMN
jgi:hypothetical protein